MTLFAALTGSVRRQHASQVAAFAAVAIGGAAYIGWWVSLPLLWSWGTGVATVKPTTALCVLALGLALVRPGKTSRFAFAVGVAAAAIGALDLLDRVGIDSGINRLNRLLVPMPGPEASFRVIDGVPIALMLTAGSLALSRFEKYYFAAIALSVLAGVVQVHALFAYLSGVHRIYDSIEAPTPLTAIGLLCVIIAIALRVGAMPALRKPRPLWHLLVTLGYAIIAPLLMFGVYAGVRITDVQFRDVRHELMDEARILSASVDREIAGEIKRLRALAASSSLHQGNFTEFQRQAEASLASRQSGNISLIDRNMQQLVNTWVPFGAPLEKVAVPESVELVFATGKPQ